MLTIVFTSPLRGCDTISTREAAVEDPTTEDVRVFVITEEVPNFMAILNTDLDTEP